MPQLQAVLQKRTYRVTELNQAAPVLDFSAIDHDAVRSDAGVSITLTVANRSQGWPMQSLRATDLPPASRRGRAMNRIISCGVENALWWLGERQSIPSGTLHAAVISAVTLGPRSTQHAAVAGFGSLAESDVNQLDRIWR